MLCHTKGPQLTFCSIITFRSMTNYAVQFIHHKFYLM